MDVDVIDHAVPGKHVIYFLSIEKTVVHFPICMVP